LTQRLRKSGGLAGQKKNLLKQQQTLRYANKNIYEKNNKKREKDETTLSVQSQEILQVTNTAYSPKKET